jgi:hypothetical protein
MPIEYRHELIDRLQFAADLSAGKAVLDIGGQHPMNHEVTHPFSLSYRKIVQRAASYSIFDRDPKPGVTYVGDLNTPQGRQLLSAALTECRPRVVLCMEILEHLSYPCEVMGILADYLRREPGICLFITLPNNGNWVINAMNWHGDHIVAFFKTVAMRFIERSPLGSANIVMRPRMQQYQWYWWLIYLAAFGQPINWGFTITAP